MKIWTLEQIFDRWPGLGFRILFESTLPILAALIWGSNVLINKGDLFSAATAACIAFSAALFAQGQILRIAKTVLDERNTVQLRNEFITIRQGIKAIRKQHFA